MTKTHPDSLGVRVSFTDILPHPAFPCNPPVYLTVTEIQMAGAEWIFRQKAGSGKHRSRLACYVVLYSPGGYFAISSQKRIRMVATSARVAFPVGLIVVEVLPVINPSAFAHCIAAVAYALIRDASV